MIDYPPPSALIKFLKPYDPEVRELALQLRSLLLEEIAPCYENIYDAYSAVAIGYGTSDRLSDGIFHIAVYPKGANLGFNDGATIPDPQGILEGKGNRIRHIKIRTPDDLKRPELRTYIRRARKQALADARKLGEPPPKKPDGMISTVKRSTQGSAGQLESAARRRHNSLPWKFQLYLNPVSCYGGLVR